MGRAGRIAILAALAAGAVVLFLVLSDSAEDSGSDGAADPTATTGSLQPPAFDVVEMRGGAPVGGVQRFTYTNGDRIRIEVTLDEPQEDVHIHGYEQEKLNPSGTVRFDFPATLDGIYELEAHGPSGDVVLAELVVNPG